MTLNASLICDGESTTLSPSNINLTAPYSYIWSANGTTLSTLSSITVSPSSTTVYTVVVTGNNGTATASATTTVQVLSNLGADCCVPSDFVPGTDFSLANTTISAFAATAGWGSSVSTANKILINGTLTIDQNFTFSNCDHIIMGPNAQINVLPGVQFEVLFSHIYSCEAMWQSINLYPDGSLRIADSQIEDGLAAVRSWGVPALLEVFSNTFDANKTAVELTEGDFSSATFYSNLFQCTRYIKPASNLEWALHHFYLRDAEHVTIGSPTHNPNVIEDARYGVFAERTDFSIQNNEFRHQHSPIVKYGIYADGFVPGSFYGQYAMNVGDLSPNIFESVRTGIFVSKNYDAFIFGNQFNSTGTGVFVYNCLARQIEVTQNTLAGFSHYGIQLQDNHDASITVSQNQMNSGFVYPADDESRKGIYVNNSTYLKAPLVIEGNDITNCYTGIQVMNQNTANIKSNVIRFSVPDAVIDLAIEYRQGIWLQLSQNLSVHGNQILRNCTSCGTTLQTGHEEYMRGIICDQALQAQVHDNTLQNIPQGMLTLQQGFGNQYFCNYLEGFISGMYFYGASIDPQGDVTNTTDNQWALGIGNKIDGELDPPGSNVDWYFDYIPGDLHDPQPYSVFVVQELGGTSSTSCNVVLPIVSEPKKLSDLLADSTYQAYLTEKKLYDRLIVYRQLKDSLQLMYSGSTYDLTLQNFFNLMALGNTGYLENVKDALNNGDKAAAEIANQQVNPSNLHEANSKCVNEILIASDKDSIYYDATGRSMLLGIAYQNPLIGGEAVYRARAILRLDLEDQMIGFRVGSISGSSSYGFEVFPNPSTGEYTVAANRLSKIPVELEAYNLLGSLVSSATIEPGASSGKLNMNYCPPGLYRLVIHHETGLTTRSIVLIR
ncbi:MAG: right-handed parallel beta-helix repeat-containing protein [Bacteroidia bacterium]|nr:right-handed parallel beta-helix repeat-containing protein [Bacteroidia bacterium]